MFIFSNFELSSENELPDVTCVFHNLHVIQHHSHRHSTRQNSSHRSFRQHSIPREPTICHR